MSDLLLPILHIATALGCALVAGIFFAFSSFVMKALGRLPAHEGIAAMQSINIAVLNPWFLAAFFGTAAACILVAILAVVRWHDAGTLWLLAGAVLYLAGNILVTRFFNVPLNDALAAAAPGDPGSAARWARYLVDWTAWNHVRTATGLAAAVLILAAVWLQARAAGPA